MSKLGNIGEIQREAGIVTLKSIQTLGTSVESLESELSNIRRNATTVLDSTSVTVRVASVEIGTRPQVNFLGGDVSITGADDTVTGEVDVALGLSSTGVSAGSYTYSSITVDAKGRITAASSGAAPTTGTGTTNTITKFTNGPSGVIGDSGITDDGTTLVSARAATLTGSWTWDMSSGTNTVNYQFDANNYWLYGTLAGTVYAQVKPGMTVLPATAATHGIRVLNDLVGVIPALQVINAGLTSEVFSVSTTGVVNSAIGYQIGAAAASGNYLRGNGSHFVSNTIQTADVPALGANPSASIGLTAVNGSATTYVRSDGAPALSQSIAPTWTGAHIFNTARTTFNAGMSLGTNGSAQSAVADNTTTPAFLLDDTISRATDDDTVTTPLFQVKNSNTGKTHLSLSHRGELGVGSSTTLAAQSAVVLGFSQSVSTETRVNWAQGVQSLLTLDGTNHGASVNAISAQLINSSGSATFAGGMTGLTAYVKATGDSSTLGAGAEIAGVVSGAGSTTPPTTATNWDAGASNAKGNWARVSLFRGGALYPAIRATAGTNLPAESNGLFLRIPGYSTITGDQWGIAVRNAASLTGHVSQATNDAVRAAAMALEFPNRTEDATHQNKLAHTYMVPKAAAAAGPAYWVASGGHYQDDGTTNTVGEYEHDGTAWRYMLNQTDQVGVNATPIVTFNNPGGTLAHKGYIEVWVGQDETGARKTKRWIPIYG